MLIEIHKQDELDDASSKKFIRSLARSGSAWASADLAPAAAAEEGAPLIRVTRITVGWLTTLAFLRP